ncbi:MAG: tetratricopeptide repeat protein, partial [Gammaproteobacteria bacterium]|nr:tetratricopeptide repeat protein [Gammaproteobacteria bacterium]
MRTFDLYWRTVLSSREIRLLKCTATAFLWGLFFAASLGGHLQPVQAQESFWSSFLPNQPEVGTPQWWKKNKNKRTFEPGKGYQVEGVAGYFDQDGRPIDRPMERTALNPKPQGLLPGVDPQIAYGRMKSAIGQGPNEEAARKIFAEAESLFEKGEYFKAGWHYRDAASRWPGSALEEDCLFMSGESHFFGDRYLKARDAYNALVEKHPNSRHMNALIDRQWE